MHFFLAVPRGLWDLSDQGLNPCPWQWKRRVLTTGPPGSSLTVASICISLIISDAEHFFMYPLATVIQLRWGRSVQVLCSFLNWVISFFFFWLLSHMSSLCMLDIDRLSEKQFQIIFSHHVGCLFILKMVSFLSRSFLVWCSPTCLFLLLLPSGLLSWGCSFCLKSLLYKGIQMK